MILQLYLLPWIRSKDHHLREPIHQEPFYLKNT